MQPREPGSFMLGKLSCRAARLGVNLGGKHQCFRSCSIADPGSVLVARSWLQVCIYSICKPVTGLTFKIADYADSCKAVHKATVI